MKRIFFSLFLILTILSISACFDLGKGDIDLQFVNNGPVAIMNIQFMNNGKLFVDFSDQINKGAETDYKLVSEEDAEYVDRASTKLVHGVFAYPVALKVHPKLGPLEADKSYSIEMTSDLCLVLWERGDADKLFGIDSGKLKINKFCPDASDLPNLPI